MLLTACRSYLPKYNKIEKYKCDTIYDFNRLQYEKNGMYHLFQRKSNVHGVGKIMDGKRQGVWHFFDDSLSNKNLFCTVTFKNGLPNGKFITYYYGSKWHEGVYSSTKTDTLPHFINDSTIEKYNGFGYYRGTFTFGDYDIIGNDTVYSWTDNVYYAFCPKEIIYCVTNTRKIKTSKNGRIIIERIYDPNGKLVMIYKTIDDVCTERTTKWYDPAKRSEYLNISYPVIY